MKKYNWFIAVLALCYLITAIATGTWILHLQQNNGSEYKVEINRLLDQMKSGDSYEAPGLTPNHYVKRVQYISARKFENITLQEAFLEPENGMGYQIEPIYEDGSLTGYVKFCYVTDYNMTGVLVVVEIILAAVAFIVLAILVYLRQNVLQPFDRFSNVPYELAKGHLKSDIEEHKSHFFGKFIWGISLLQDRLESDRRKELRLEKEKKMMILSISHDVKTPLNNIKLYAKALEEGLYTTEEEKKNAVCRIEEKTAEIEHFVSEIVKTSSEDVLDIEVERGEFYMKELVEQIAHTYHDKCKLKHLDFQIGTYENKLLKGDMDRTIEVIENVIENAFKYGDGRKIEITFYEEDYCQLLRIHNMGDPVTEQEFNHIFDSFFRGGNAQGREGSGLGLYICRQIMQKMDGDIFAECCEDGMNFTLVFAE